MKDKIKEAEVFDNKSTVYGPVKSWRYGMSLGVDPIFNTSTCSFNCIYCQLGNIQKIVRELKVYVATEKVIEDFGNHLKNNPLPDVITFSGSGEPTLALNLGEMVQGLRKLNPNLPQFVLTNSTELSRPEVQLNLAMVDKVIVKIDASDEDTFQKINRPAAGITLKETINSILEFKKTYKGSIEVQSMFMPLNSKHLEDFADILNLIKPEVVQLNTPKRPYPMEWHRENRGNHKLIFDYQTRELKKVTESDAQMIETLLKEKTGLEIHSVYQK